MPLPTATASPSLRGTKQSSGLTNPGQCVYPDCHVATLLAMTADAIADNNGISVTTDRSATSLQFSAASLRGTKQSSELTVSK
ncbi:MAG: hypothetical protein LBF85_05165 [Tannerella sp.]|nr:hypothetical protein [Tannerella sp.]